MATCFSTCHAAVKLAGSLSAAVVVNNYRGLPYYFQAVFCSAAHCLLMLTGEGWHVGPVFLGAACWEAMLSLPIPSHHLICGYYVITFTAGRGRGREGGKGLQLIWLLVFIWVCEAV